MTPNSDFLRHVLSVEETEDTIIVTYAKGGELPEPEPEVEDDDEDEDERQDDSSPWLRVEGWEDLPEHRREALLDLGPIARTAQVLPSSRDLSGFQREADESFVFLLSEPVVGRDGFILAGPWELDEYRLNPVVLWQHNITMSDDPDDLLPVGRALQVREPTEGTLISELEFDTQSGRGARLDRLYRQGFLSTVSARWYPRQIVQANQIEEDSPYHNADPEVFVMFGNRLIEQSAVTIPGLASATLLEGPMDTGRALEIIREHITDPALFNDLEAVMLSAPAPRDKPAAADPTNPEPANWWDDLTPKD